MSIIFNIFCFSLNNLTAKNLKSTCNHFFLEQSLFVLPNDLRINEFSSKSCLLNIGKLCLRNNLIKVLFVNCSISMALEIYSWSVFKRFLNKLCDGAEEKTSKLSTQNSLKVEMFILSMRKRNFCYDNFVWKVLNNLWNFKPLSFHRNKFTIAFYCLTSDDQTELWKATQWKLNSERWRHGRRSLKRRSLKRRRSMYIRRVSRVPTERRSQHGIKCFTLYLPVNLQWKHPLMCASIKLEITQKGKHSPKSETERWSC